MIHELKRYEAAPGKAHALVERFRTTTMPLFERHGIELLHCWLKPDEPGVFYYLVSFADAVASAKAWKDFGADPDWAAAKAATETDGPLLARQTTTTLEPTVFSPSRAA
jgi:hypothetical protein